jgi:hypothetical protein
MKDKQFASMSEMTGVTGATEMNISSKSILSYLYHINTGMTVRKASLVYIYDDVRHNVQMKRY